MVNGKCSMTNVFVRFAEPADVLAIVDFNQRMALETEDKLLPAEMISAGVAAVFADAQQHKGFYLVAETEIKEIVGSLLITFEWSDWRDGWIWWIQSVYVSETQRGAGVYRKMYDWAKSQACARGDVRGFRLYVEKENANAQAVYEKLGMRETVYKMYEEML